MTELGLRTIPGYTVNEILESDLVSVTYLAERQADGYPVFLHVVSEEFDDAQSAAAFFEAHERVSQIGHPVLPTVEDLGQASGLLYSVTSAVESRSLVATLRATGRLDATEALAICGELGDTLDILHAADVVHGAINPHTVWINDRTRAPSAPRVSLRGFGISPLQSPRASAERSGPPPDDLLYVAPEQLRQDEVSGRADQYALACMAVHCLSGTPPFERATINALLGAHLFAAPMLADGQWERLPPHIVHAVQRALEKDPADRFSLCGAFATAIGAEQERSWTWMVREALGLSEVDAGSDGGRGEDGEDDGRGTPPHVGDTTAELTVIDGDLSISADADRRPGRGHLRAAEARPAARNADARDGDGTSPTAWFDDLDRGHDTDATDRDSGQAGADDAHGAHVTDATDGIYGTSAGSGARQQQARDDADLHGWPLPSTWQPESANTPAADQPGHTARADPSDHERDSARRSSPPTSPSGSAAPSRARQPSRGALDHDATMRSLADADWLPGNSGEPGTAQRRTRRPRPDGRAGARADAPIGRPTDGPAGIPDERIRDPQVLRWLAVAIVTLLMVATIAVLALRTPAEAPDQPTAVPQQQSQRAPPESAVTTVWQQTVATTRVTSMLATPDALVSGSQTGVTAVDPATGDERWQTPLDETITEVTAIDGAVIARSASAMHVFDDGTGEVRWDTATDAATPTAMAAGNGAIYEVTPYGGNVRVRALALDTGDELWSLDDLQAAGGGTWAVYDASERGGHMLYVLTGSRLHAVDTERGDLRWQRVLDGPQPASLTAFAGAILVIDEQGQICRYGMRDGGDAWSDCATLESGPGMNAALRTRNGRVIVRSADEIAGVDFTSGTAQWRIDDDLGFQRPFAANATTVFVAHNDGDVEAIDHQRGIERWRSGTFGEITAMAADPKAVYVATAQGQITRLQSSDDDTSTG